MPYSISPYELRTPMELELAGLRALGGIDEGRSSLDSVLVFLYSVLRKKDAKKAMTKKPSSETKGQGYAISVIRGANIANVRANAFDIPMAVVTNCVGMIRTVPTLAPTISMLAPNRVIMIKIHMR